MGANIRRRELIWILLFVLLLSFWIVLTLEGPLRAAPPLRLWLVIALPTLAMFMIVMGLRSIAKEGARITDKSLELNSRLIDQCEELLDENAQLGFGWAKSQGEAEKKLRQAEDIWFKMSLRMKDEMEALRQNQSDFQRNLSRARSLGVGRLGNSVRFPSRAAWLKERLLERGWSNSDPSEYSGPDRKTIEKILRGEGVRNDVLERLAEALSAKQSKVSALDIPKD
jgi:hypothetical protein